MSDLHALIAERLPGQRFGVFFNTGEGMFFPNGDEQQSGFVVAEDGTHWSYWTDYELVSGRVVIEGWQPVFNHWQWADSHEYQRALAAAHVAQPGESRGTDMSSEPVCPDCGMRHAADDTAACIEGHGEP